MDEGTQWVIDNSCSASLEVASFFQKLVSQFERLEASVHSGKSEYLLRTARRTQSSDSLSSVELFILMYRHLSQIL